MLKQLFNSEQILKVFSNKDIWQWDVLNAYGDAERAAIEVAKTWKTEGYGLSPLKIKNIKGKTVFSASELKDHLSIKLVDRFLRQVYKVRQSDRNRVVRQVIALMGDPSDLVFVKVDVENCFESINFKDLIEKLKTDMILSPTSIAVLEDVAAQARLVGNSGLPRGLSISSTLAELFLEKLDKLLSENKNIFYMARYVDDIVLAVPSYHADFILNEITLAFGELGLKINESKSERYVVEQSAPKLELLGYSLSSKRKNKSPNIVEVKIAPKKIKKIKTRIALSFLDFKKNRNFKLLLDRMYFLSTLHVIKENANGRVLAGNAYNYMYVSNLDDYKKIDGFYFSLMTNARYRLSSSEITDLNKISFYSMAKHKKIMNLTKKRLNTVKEAWKNAEKN